jgi:hypothetical protein
MSSAQQTAHTGRDGAGAAVRPAVIALLVLAKLGGVRRIVPFVC